MLTQRLTNLFSIIGVLNLLLICSIVSLDAVEFHQEMVGSFGAILTVARSQDGTQLAFGGSEGVINLVNANTLERKGQIINETSDMDYVYSLAFSPDGTEIAQGSGDGVVIIWDIASHSRIMTLVGHLAAVFCVDWSSDGTKIVSSSGDRTVKIWNAQTGALLNTLIGHGYAVRGCAFSPNGGLIASGSEGFSVPPFPELKVWDTGTGICLWTNDSEHTSTINSVVFSPDGIKIATSAFDATVRIWDVATGTCLDTLSTQEYENFSVDWSPDGTMVASGETWYQVAAEIWNANTGELITALGLPSGPSQYVHPVYAISFSLDNNYLFTGGNGWNLRKWDISTGSYIDSLVGHNAQVMDADWSPDGNKIVSAGADGTAKIWDSEGNWLLTLQHSPSEMVDVSCVDWSGDGTIIATGSHEHEISMDRDSIKIWNAATGVLLSVFDEPWEYINSVAFSPNSEKLAAGCGYNGGSDFDIRIWDIASGTLLGTMVGHTDMVRSVSWSPDGTKLASGSMDNTIKIWDVSTYSILHTLYDHTEQVMSVSWSQDGTRLASGGGDYFGSDFAIRIWDASTGSLIRTLTGHSFIVESVSWSEVKVASASSDHTLRIWDAETGTLEEILHGHLGGLSAVRWLDSARLVTASNDRTWRIWLDTTAVAVEEIDPISRYPRSLIKQVNPNPFSHTTIVVYQLLNLAHISLRIYDATGRLVKTLVDDEKKNPGIHEGLWDGKDNKGHRVTAGVYFCRLETDGFSQTRKLILLR